MTGPEHYLEAERILSELNKTLQEGAQLQGASVESQRLIATSQLARAQVHATLALAAATATQLTGQFIELDEDAFAWNEAAGIPPRGIQDVHLP